MRRNKKLGLALLAICPLLSSCGQKQTNAPPVSAAAPAAASQIDVIPVKSQRLSAMVQLPAELVAYQSVDIYSKEPGFLKTISVDRGSQVKQGQVIAEIEAPELVAQKAGAQSSYQGAQSQLAAGQAKLSADQSTYRRLSTAAKTPGVVAQNDLEIAQAAARADEENVAALGQAVNTAQETLKAVSQLEAYLRIRAPFDGQVTNRYVHPGALVGPSGGAAATPIVRIETLNRHRLVIAVPENDAAGIPVGTQVVFTVPTFPGKKFQAPIARISHGVDMKTRTMPVELDVRDPRAELVPGTFCAVEWPIHRTYPTLAVPATAVGTDLERTFIIRVRNNHTEWVDVKTGVRSGAVIEVFGDLKEGDQIAVRGTDQLRPGTEVKPRPVAQP